MKPIWERTPTPEESWSDASGGNEDGEWPVRGIVGEQIRCDSTSRYEVRWDNWSRKDGSNTTWQSTIVDRPEIVNRWKRTQQRKRKDLAEVSTDMDVEWPDNAVHKRLTEQRAQAYEEKKARWIPVNLAVDWDEEITKAYERVEEPDAEDKTPHLRIRRNAGAASSVAPSRRNRTSSSPALSRDRGARPTPQFLTPKRARPLNPPASSSQRAMDSVSIPPSAQFYRQILCRLKRLQTSWDRAAKDVLAATIRISSDISDEDIPLNLKSFKYIERGYTFDDGLQNIFEVSRDVFTICDCSTCLHPEGCHCQDSSEIYDDADNKVFAYSNGLYAFDAGRGMQVIECNKYCSCSRNCANRVAQHSRDVPIEIFDTGTCGWGVRALTRICAGKVIGTYAGYCLLNVFSRREDAEDLREHQGYLFDLDGTEVWGGENLGDKYTVDSYTCGNWTRFVNHSCDPNMLVYSVVYDSIPDVNMPYVAFVATEDIAAGTELTIDYHPHADEKIGKKGKSPADGRACKCGTSKCRGWLK
ncbi:hypothetical protein F5I97DRAFT_1802012 [Phlebopus sp. FC_14]|nr:hypothetical protein F5I97DRAFT_1802012 [Phlebopus sp. FC_14]